MTSDLNRSLSLEYALGTNLPERIIHPGGHIRNYYTPAGRKTGKKVFDASNNQLSRLGVESTFDFAVQQTSAASVKKHYFCRTFNYSVYDSSAKTIER